MRSLFLPLGLKSLFFWGWGGWGFQFHVPGANALMSLLEFNEEGPDFLRVHGDDGASWWPWWRGGVAFQVVSLCAPVPALQHLHIPGPCE